MERSSTEPALHEMCRQDEQITNEAVLEDPFRDKGVGCVPVGAAGRRGPSRVSYLMQSTPIGCPITRDNLDRLSPSCHPFENNIEGSPTKPLI